MPNIHDSGYKFLFSNRTIFRQLVETFVDQDWVKMADFDHAEKIDKSFVAEDYRRTESDLIYRVPFKGRGGVHLVLLEFQSRPERFMAVRVLHYICGFYLDYVRSRKKVRYLPAVFPIVLYNGRRKWTAPTRFSELIEGGEVLGRYGVDFSYFKIAENEYSREALLSIRNIVSTLFLAEGEGDVEGVVGELLGLFDREEDREAVSYLINWFGRLAVEGRIGARDYGMLSSVYGSQEEVRTMLIETLERDRRKRFEEGLNLSTFETFFPEKRPFFFGRRADIQYANGPVLLTPHRPSTEPFRPSPYRRQTT